MIGTVIERRSDDFVVDIGGPFAAVLNTLAFEGATRRNRPKLVEGDLVYARVVFAHKDTDTELTCLEVTGKVGLSLHLACPAPRQAPALRELCLLCLAFSDLACMVYAGRRLWTIEGRDVHRLRLRAVTQVACSAASASADSARRDAEV